MSDPAESQELDTAWFTTTTEDMGEVGRISDVLMSMS